MLRTKRVVTLVTLPDWNEADPRLQKYADYRLWCRERPIGFFQPYKVKVPFNAGGEGARVRTSRIAYGDKSQRVAFPNMDAEGDPYYRYVTKRKSELIHSETWDADEFHGEGDAGGSEPVDPDEIERRKLTEVALRLYQPWDDETKFTYEEVADAIGEKSDTWVGNRVREWENGEHRDLAPTPAEA